MFYDFKVENFDLIFFICLIIETFINKMCLFAISLLNKRLINCKSRIGNNLETSKILWSALFFYCLRQLSDKEKKCFELI